MSDVDGIPGGMPPRYSEADVLIPSRIANADRRIAVLPWAVIPAAGVWFNGTTGARAFASYLKDYITSGFAKGGTQNWYLDQNALFYGWLDLRDQIAFRRLGFGFRQGGRRGVFAADASKLHVMESALDAGSS